MRIAPALVKRTALFCVIAAAFASVANAEEYVKSYAVDGRADVRVHADDSSVKVVTSDTNQVEFRVMSEGFAAINIGGKLHVDSHQNGNQVELTVHVIPGVTIGINSRRLSTEVRMPRSADLQLETTDGRVEVSDVKGNISIYTGDGTIHASQLAGTVDIRSKDGGVTADAVTGSIKLHSGDGAITGTRLDGKCAAASGDGRIRLTGRFDALDVKSADGSVTAHVEPGSKMSSTWSIATKDGAIDVDLPRDFQADIDASTRDGRISLGLPVAVQGEVAKTRVNGKLNGGGPPLIIHTGDGSIHINGI